MYRNTWMEINLDAIEDNVKRCAEISGKRIIAVLKADAYGCGDSYVAKAVLEAGAKMIAVSSIDEAMMLRNESYTGPLLILGATEPDDVETLITNNISTAAFSTQWVNEILKHNVKGLRVHMKVDTGMNRIGFKDNISLKEACETLSNAGCIIEGIFTHFCCADTDPALTKLQYDRFAEAVKYVNYPFEWIHCDNSDATVSFKDPLSNACRLGITMYGPSAFIKDMRYPISLHTKVVMVKTVKAGETIGYGAAYTAKNDELIATLPIGYADGFIRANSGRYVYIDGQMAQIVGRVCMDQTMVRLEHEVPVGTPVEIFGSHIHLEDMADDLNTITYEIICLISGRVTRTYVWHGKKYGEENTHLVKSEQMEI